MTPRERAFRKALRANRPRLPLAKRARLWAIEAESLPVALLKRAAARAREAGTEE
jgi:hypothetical protein